MQHTAALQPTWNQNTVQTRNRKVHNYTWGLQNYQQFIEQLDQKEQRCRIIENNTISQSDLTDIFRHSTKRQ